MMKIFSEQESTDDTDSLADSLETVRIHNHCTRQEPCLSCRSADLLSRGSGLGASRSIKKLSNPIGPPVQTRSSAGIFARNVSDVLRSKFRNSRSCQKDGMWFRSSKPWRSRSQDRMQYERELRPVEIEKICLHDLPKSNKWQFFRKKPGRQSCSCSDASEASTSCDSCSPSWQSDTSCSDWSSSCCHCESGMYPESRGWKQPSVWDESCILPRYRNQHVHFNRRPEVFHYWQESLRPHLNGDRCTASNCNVFNRQQEHARQNYAQNWQRLGGPANFDIQPLSQSVVPVGFSRYNGNERKMFPPPISFPFPSSSKPSGYIKNSKNTVKPRRYAGHTTVAGHGPSSRHPALLMGDDRPIAPVSAQPKRHTVDGGQVISNRRKQNRALSSHLFLCCSETHSNLSVYPKPIRRTDC